MYELRIDVFCENEVDYTDVMDKLDDLKPIMKVINPGQLNQQCSVIDLILNRHDESPRAPCTEISHWDNCPVL